MSLDPELNKKYYGHVLLSLEVKSIYKAVNQSHL